MRMRESLPRVQARFNYDTFILAFILQIQLIIQIFGAADERLFMGCTRM